MKYYINIKIKDKSATIYFTSSLVDKMDIIYLMKYLDKLKSIKDLDLLIYIGNRSDYNNINTKCKSNCKFHTTLISNLFELTLKRTIQQNKRIEILSKRTIREKLLSYFSLLSGKEFNKTITLPFSLTNLADYLSVDRSAMMRELKTLSDEGFILKNGNKITLLF